MLSVLCRSQFSGFTIIGLKNDEIEQLIERLRLLHNGSSSHFHLTNNNGEAGGIYDIEIYVSENDSHNMKIM
jgi:hypothetical protein